MNGLDPALILAFVLVAATPILLAALGELVVERAGVLNLGVEGMMITGAICGFICAVTFDNTYIGFLGAAIGGALISMIFAFLVLVLLANQVATGLALTIFGLGLSALLGRDYNGVKSPSPSKIDFGPLADIPIIGQALFNQDIIVYFALFLAFATTYFLKYSRAGLILRAVGENAQAAHALGIKVRRVRLACIAFGGATAGIGGAYISLARVPQWADGMTAGAGWIALAIVVFAGWRPVRCLLGALLFGGLNVLQFNLQAIGVPIPASVLSMLPFVATIIVLAFMSSGRAPGSLGQPFHASS